MKKFFDAAPLAAPDAPGTCSPSGWVRFFDLEPNFQLFLLAEMAAQPTTTEVFHHELFVAASLVNEHASHDFGGRVPPTIAEDDLYLWYPLERLSVHCVPHLLAAELAVHPSDAALFNGKVHMRKELIEPYVAGDTVWLDHWPKPPQ